MRRTILFLVALLTAAFAVTAARNGAIAADTPVQVLAADNVILRLPVSPSVDRIVGDLEVELTRLATAATDPRLATALERMATDRALLRHVATSPVERFDAGIAAATATAVYDVVLDPDTVTVVVATVELVPGYGSTAGSREHEDGHALINKTVALRCAAAGLANLVGSGQQGNTLINGLINYLSDASDPVHSTYHTYVKRARYGEHIRYAERALDEVDSCP